MEMRRICRLLSLLSMAALGWIPVAFSDTGEAPSNLAEYVSEYVYLHETRNQGFPLQIAARASMCRGKTGGARN